MSDSKLNKKRELTRLRVERHRKRRQESAHKTKKESVRPLTNSTASSI